MVSMNGEARVTSCIPANNVNHHHPTPPHPTLLLRYNILTDPSEYKNVAVQYPVIAGELTARLIEVQNTVFSPQRGASDFKKGALIRILSSVVSSNYRSPVESVLVVVVVSCLRETGHRDRFVY